MIDGIIVQGKSNCRPSLASGEGHETNLADQLFKLPFTFLKSTPLLRSNIPRSALCETLDTYYFNFKVFTCRTGC
jgi:hypothetical protein